MQHLMRDKAAHYKAMIKLGSCEIPRSASARATGSRNGPRNGQHWTFWLEDQLTIMGLAVGFSTPALGLEGMVLCSAAALSQQQP
ncbi:MAG: hypothetical protein FRX49_05266 [Trebouxia sp. A1-2]|nr:MAG: hypothetical protein FRX49_05266 [Trebouxia sp. A1-2]